MSKTADNLIYKAASILGKAVAGETIGAVEYQTIDSCIDDVLDEISSIVYIGDRNDISEKYFQTIARLLAIHAAAEFAGVPVDLEQVTQHENRLRYLATQKRPYQPVKMDFF